MKKILIFAVLATALATCLPAMGGGTLQPADMTVAQTPWESEVRPGDTNPPAWDERVAEDWKCTDGQLIGMVRWWGSYHPYESTNAGPADPPAFQPTAFILRQYEDNSGAPGNLLNEVLMPIADCSQAYYGTAPVTGGFYNHVFGYEAVLPAPWTQTRDSIYWLSVQAQFSRDPVFDPPPTGDGYLHWEWVSTPPGAFEGRGHHMINGGPWVPIWIVDPSEVINFAFEIGALPVSTTPNKTSFQQTDSISITADVAAISTPCYPFVRVIQPNGQALYLQEGAGFLPSVTPYLGLMAGAIPLPLIQDYPVLTDARFSNMPVGTYRLESGAVDPVTTDINNLQYIGIVDSTPLAIQ